MAFKGKVLETWNKLWEDDEEGSSEFLNGVDETNRSIEKEKMITRNQEQSEGEETEKVEDAKVEDKAETDEAEKETEQTEVVVTDDVVEAVVARMAEVENEEIVKLRTIAKELAEANDAKDAIITELGEQMAEVKNRLAQLEKSEADRKREYLQDTPRKNQVKTVYKPRQNNDNGVAKTAQQQAKELAPPNAY